MGSEGLVERWDELTGPKPFTCVTAPAYFLVTASDGLARFSCNQQALSGSQGRLQYAPVRSHAAQLPDRFDGFAHPRQDRPADGNE
jgi:hypothetical protein